jgi:ActR/RegA family two-component response regulator
MIDSIPEEFHMSETMTILVVEDEDAVRRTFREWLDGAALGCLILTAEDAESALRQANQHRIDLAILDWNLGAGNDGLKVLEDLQVFNADVVAIMITGFADQATPVQAMRMGVRDYLDKNQDLNRTTFLRAVRTQLERIRPARRERQIQQGLRDFHTAVEKILPLVQTTTTLQEPVPFTDAVRGLLRALVLPTRAQAAFLIVLDEESPPRVLDQTGAAVAVPTIAPGRTLAASTLPFQGPVVLDNLAGLAGSVELFPFERDRRALLAVPLIVSPRTQAVLELFDPVEPFREEDRRLAALLAPLAEDLLRQAVAERQTSQLLLDAIQAALHSSRELASTLEVPTTRPEDPPPASVLDTIRQGLPDTAEAADTVRLAEAIRALSVRYGSAAIRHCIAVVEGLRALLDQTTGTGEPTS